MTSASWALFQTSWVWEQLIVFAESFEVRTCSIPKKHSLIYLLGLEVNSLLAEPRVLDTATRNIPLGLRLTHPCHFYPPEGSRAYASYSSKKGVSSHSTPLGVLHHTA